MYVTYVAMWIMCYVDVCCYVYLGWDVDAGDIHEPGLSPDLLISLTAPKLCSKQFRGRYHYLGLRMIPAKLLHEYQLRIPHYPGTDQIVRIN